MCMRPIVTFLQHPAKPKLARQLGGRYYSCCSYYLYMNIFTLANLYALLWWIRHTEAGYYANVVVYYANVMDTPYGGRILC